MMGTRELTASIKSRAIELGFDAVGIVRAESLTDEAKHLASWLGSGRHGEMSYMKRHEKLRVDPAELLPGAKSIICLAHNYYNPQMISEGGFRIARYAYGKDYHNVLRKKLKQLMAHLREVFPDCNGRICVDSAPIMERAWAMRSGLGWIGKNGCLITKKRGSFQFLAEVILDFELAYDAPETDHCGKCRACIDACPTGAIVEPRFVDSRKCISYLTIELKGAIPEEMRDVYEKWIYGCDVCQEACPHNRFARLHSEPRFLPSEALLGMSDDDWRELSVEQFRELFHGSACQRAKYAGFVRNIKAVED